MQRGLFLVSILGLVTLGLAAMGGCSPTGSFAPDVMLDLSDANNESLRQIGDRFLSLARDMSGPEAAAALLAELEGGFAGVAAASLSADGCTIFVEFSDGAVALLNTNQAVFGPSEAPPVNEKPAVAAMGAPTARKAVRGATARMLPGSFECPNRDTPATRAVLIINAAAVSHPSTDGYVEQIRNSLITQGWSPAEIDERSRAGTGNRTFAPTSLLEAEGYGMVFVIAHGCVADSGGGVQHSFIQCCRPGRLLDVISAGMAAEMIGERDSGRLIRCDTAAEHGGFVEDIYIRDDCLIQRMKVTPGALVYFVAPHSWSVAEGLPAQGAGATLGWDGAFAGEDGQRAVLGMISRMTADNTWTTDSQAYANLMLSGLGLSEDPVGHATQARIAGTEGDFYLPAWAAFTVDPVEVPDDAVQVEVDVAYADCPEFDLSFSMTVSDVVETLRMPAGEATIAVRALNVSNEVVGTGLHKVLLNGGRNDITLTTCKATVRLYPREYPESGANALARLRVEFVYPYTLPDTPPPVELALSDVAGWSTELWAAPVSVRSTGMNSAGQVIGEQIQEADVECGNQTIDVCFGWVRLEATRHPTGTETIRVVSDSDRAPGPFTLSPGGSVEAYGFRVDGTVHFTAEALDASGSAIASVTETVTIACGENAVALDLLSYGITVSADPTEIAADGLEQSRITATLRYWRTGDTMTPTGEPVVGTPVLFGTTLGLLSGPNPVATDSNGRAVIQLSGTTSGTATVVASVEEDRKEGKCIVQIGSGDGEAAQRLFVIYHGQGQDVPGGVHTVAARVYDADDRGVPNAPVRFRLVSGSVQLVEPLEVLTNEDGFAEVEVRSAGPAVGLIEVTVAGTSLVKRCVAYLQLSCTVSPQTASIAIDTGEQRIEVIPTANLNSLGIPRRWIWHMNTRQWRPIRGGTDHAPASAAIESVPDTDYGTVQRGGEPDTAMGFSPRLEYEVAGEWEQLGWVPGPQECLVDFFQDVACTIPVSVESRSKRIELTGIYQARVVARFAGSGPAGNIRYIVSNPKDHGQVTSDWYDGANRPAANSTSQVSIIIVMENYQAAEPPDAWIAQKVQSYEEAYGGLSIRVSDYPFEVHSLSNLTRSVDPWANW